jgi:hypothetical protein
MIKTRLRAALRCDFLRREDGTIAIEAMIIMPMMFWTFLALFSIFDTYRMYGLNQKASYTIADAVSRETLPIDNDYVDGVHEMFEYLASSQGNTAMRISQVRYDADGDKFYKDWSTTRGNLVALTNADVVDWQDRLPNMVDEERVIIVETVTTFDPPFNTGLEQREIVNFVFTRPRYAPRVCLNTCE